MAQRRLIQNRSERARRWTRNCAGREDFRFVFKSRRHRARKRARKIKDDNRAVVIERRNYFAGLIAAIKAISFGGSAGNARKSRRGNVVGGKFDAGLLI